MGDNVLSKNEGSYEKATFPAENHLNSQGGLQKWAVDNSQREIDLFLTAKATAGPRKQGSLPFPRWTRWSSK